MRIIVAHSHLNTRGGGERVTLELLARLGRRHEVILWAGDYGPGATFADLAGFTRRDLRSWEWLTARPDADAVVANTFGANLLALRHPNTICYLHTFRSVYLRRTDRLDLIARRLLDWLALHRASGVATNSRYAAQQTARIFGVQAEVVPCGVSEDFFGVPEDPGIDVLYVGRLAPEKGVERLLEWTRALDVRVAIAGSGSKAYEAHLRQRAGPRVEWLGPLEGAALLQAYARARLVAFLPHEEEFGLVALEAMAAARPVVTVPEGGIPELVEDGVTGYLVRDAAMFAASVQRLASDTNLCRRMGQAGRRIARQYTWETMTARIEALCLAGKEAKGRPAGS